ncbi:MAG TPA: hypothetical protein VFI65_34190 [Streptosporangiaceae bacterium]|nr:hypothetical protein [Streptosporangiaceae bacterium]
MSNEVADLLTALHDGTLSLAEVAERFRTRSWPGQPAPPARTHLDLAEADLGDPEPYIPGSYDDVALAYDQGKLTDTQYAVLADAIAESIRAHNEDR